MNLPVLDVAWGASGPLLAYIGPGAGFTFVGSFLILFLALLLAVGSALTWPIRAAFWAIFRARRTGQSVKRVVVVGLDGLDPDRVRKLMAEGRLPHFQELAERGTLTDLQTTLPPISPVAWSTFMTGVNPGKHNIFDFLNRDLRSYLPELSSAKVNPPGTSWLSRWGLGGAPVRLLRKSQPFWKILGTHGVFSTILRVPITFPPEKFHGLSLSAMCTPDLRGSQGTFTLITTDPAERDHTGGFYITVTRHGDRIETRLPGPPRPSPRRARPGTKSAAEQGQSTDLEVPLSIQIDTSRNQAVLRVAGQRITLLLKQYSPWIKLVFRGGLFTRAHGVCRFRLESLAPHFRLYVTPINIDPEHPALPISHPLYYSIYLAKLHDTFATLGLAEDTWALNSGAIDEAAFLEQAYEIHAERERMFFDALHRTRRGLCACVFDASDRIQHMFYRYDNGAHPANAGRDRELHRHAIDEMYVRMDDLVGRVRATIDDETVLIVLSDHGFCEFSRGVNLNTWLREKGYLVLRDQPAGGDYLADVDWSKTRAYAFGLSGIYLNQAGRESRGIVLPGEAVRLKNEIAAELRGLTDGGVSPLHQVYESQKAYSGPYAGNGPDLVIGYRRGYRASWEAVVGRTDGPLFSDNTRPWSGDHCVDPNLVPGVLLCNRKLDRPDPSIIDMAPTILTLFGVPVPSYMDGVAIRLSNPGNGTTRAANVVEPKAVQEIGA